MQTTTCPLLRQYSGPGCVEYYIVKVVNTKTGVTIYTNSQYKPTTPAAGGSVRLPGMQAGVKHQVGDGALS